MLGETEGVGENENRCKRRDIEVLIISVFESAKLNEYGTLLEVYQKHSDNGTEIAQFCFNS